MNKEQIENFLAEGKSLREIGRILQISLCKVRYWIKKFDIVLPQYTFKCECGETNPEKFYKGKSTLCTQCVSKNTVCRNRKNKLLAVAYKGSICQRCGYDKYIGALQFHHRNPDLKDPNWNLIKNRHFDKIKEELDKCDLLCSNCHAEVHHEIRMSKKNMPPTTGQRQDCKSYCQISIICGDFANQDLI